MNRSLPILMLASLALAACSVSNTRTPQTPITSQSALQHYIETTPASQSPLTTLSPGARSRFLDSLVWGQQGVGGFAVTDLELELNRKQARAILNLFDLAASADAMDYARPRLRGATPPTAIDQDYTAFENALHSAAEVDVAELTREAYLKHVAPHKPAGVSAHDAYLLFEAGLGAADRDPGSAIRYLRDARRSLDALAHHHQASPQRLARLRQAMLTARDIDGAHQLSQDFPDAGLPPLPVLVDQRLTGSGLPTVLRVDPGGQRLERESADRLLGPSIVVVAGCHFSVDAVTAIEADPELAKIFREQGLWLADPGESIPGIIEWNRDHPTQPMYPAWSKAEWNQITSWAMPTFYLFDSGKVIDQWSGWPDDATGLADLRRHLEQNGFIAVKQ